MRMHNHISNPKPIVRIRSEESSCTNFRDQNPGSSRKAWLLITIFFAIHSPFLILFLGGIKKGEKNNQSPDQKSCLSARSESLHNTKFRDQNRNSEYDISAAKIAL